MRNSFNQRFSWHNLSHLVCQELKVFAYCWTLIMVFRIAFLVIMSGYISSGVSMGDIAAALVYGGKISLKSAGILALMSAACSLLINGLGFNPAAIRRIIGAILITGLTFLFCARIPYYEQFHSGFNQLIFNTLNDDMYALLVSLIDQFNLIWRLLGVGVLSAALTWPLWRLLSWHPEFIRPAANRWLRYGRRMAAGACLYFFMIFCSFGGSMSFAGNVDWENSGVTKDKLLNEAILDDLQALYRASEINGRMESSTGLAYTADDVKLYAKYLSGNDIESDSLRDYLSHQAQGRAEQPRQVFIILSESYANWPLQDKYAALHLADGMKQIIAQDNTAYCADFLPNGMSTISAVMGIVTGMADANLYLTTMPEAYKEPYLTSLAPQLKKLGYSTEFWYAGPSSWEGVREFSLAQGFDKFYGSGDYPAESGSVWGCDDEYLYRAVLEQLDANRSGFYLLLNASNHSPYTVDLDKAGFDAAAVRAALPDDRKNDEQLVRQLGHHWYADRQLSDFIKKAQAKCPDSVFIVVGDHADRVNVERTPTMYDRYVIPFIITGKGISRSSLPKNVAGSQIDIMPTLLELTAPAGFTYYSIGNSLTKGQQIGINYGFWITPNSIGKTDGAAEEPQVISELPAISNEAVDMQVNAVRCLSWWQGKYGTELK